MPYGIRKRNLTLVIDRLLSNNIKVLTSGLIKYGSKVGFSMRGVGNIQKTGGLIKVNKPLSILTYDWVIHPSHQEAYQTAICESSSSANEFLNLSESTGIFVPVHTQDAINYIKDYSKNLQMVAESMQFDISNPNKIKLANDYKSVSIQEGNDTIIVKTEDYLFNEINNYLKKL